MEHRESNQFEPNPANTGRNDEGIDLVLRRSLAAPVPTLPADFDRRVVREVIRRSQPLDRRRQMLLAGYAAASVLVSAVLMRGEGLGWAPIAGMILAPLAAVAITRSAFRAKHATTH